MANENIVVEARVREFVARCGEDLRMSGEFLEALNGKVKDVIQEAVARAKENGRKTVQPHDI